MSPLRIGAWVPNPGVWRWPGQADLTPGAITPPPPPTPLDPATIGVPQGQTLSPMAGGRNTQSNVTITDKVITGDLTLAGSNVTLRRCRITGHLILSQGTGYTLDQCDVGSIALSGAKTVRITSMKIINNLGKDAIHVTANPTAPEGRSQDVIMDTVYASITRDEVLASGNHYDGIQLRGVLGLTLRNFALLQEPFTSRYNACIFVQEANGGNTDVVFEDGWVRGGGYQTLSLFGPAAQNTVRRLHIDPGDGSVAASGSIQPGVWTDNVWWGGPNDGQPIAWNEVGA